MKFQQKIALHLYEISTKSCLKNYILKVWICSLHMKPGLNGFKKINARAVKVERHIHIPYKIQVHVFTDYSLHNICYQIQIRDYPQLNSVFLVLHIF